MALTVRGIFIWFPTNQAGWLIYVPQPRQLVVSMDVAFDEDFVSAGLCYNHLLVHDAQPTRGSESYVDPFHNLAHTGPPHGLASILYPRDHDTPHLSQMPGVNYEDDFTYVDEFTNPPAILQPSSPVNMEEYKNPC